MWTHVVQESTVYTFANMHEYFCRVSCKVSVTFTSFIFPSNGRWECPFFLIFGNAVYQSFSLITSRPEYLSCLLSICLSFPCLSFIFVYHVFCYFLSFPFFRSKSMALRFFFVCLGRLSPNSKYFFPNTLLVFVFKF